MCTGCREAWYSELVDLSDEAIPVLISIRLRPYCLCLNCCLDLPSLRQPSANGGAFLLGSHFYSLVRK